MIKKKSMLISAFFLVVIVLTGMCSCAGSKAALAEEVMQEKYGVTFHTERTQDASNGFYAWLSSAELPGVLVRAYVHEESKTAVDNCIQKKVSKEVSDETGQILQGVNADMYIRTDQILEFSNGDMDMTPQEYVRNNPGEEFRINIITSASDQDLRELLGKIPEIRRTFGYANGYIKLFIVDNETVGKAQKEIEDKDSMYDMDVLELLSSGKEVEISMSPYEPVPTFDQLNTGTYF